MERFREIKGLKDYLKYLTLKKKYEAKKVGASLTFKKKKVNYVLQQLHVFDENVDSQCMYERGEGRKQENT
jgi:hypothetical protein